MFDALNVLYADPMIQLRTFSSSLRTKCCWSPLILQEEDKEYIFSLPLQKKTNFQAEVCKTRDCLWYAVIVANNELTTHGETEARR